MITGAAGLISSAVTEILVRYIETQEGIILICAVGCHETKKRDRFSEYYDRNYFHFVSYDSSRSNNQFVFHCDYIIHGAANSSPKIIVNEPVETMFGNYLDIKKLLDFAEGSKAKRVLYISSSEVYGKKERDGAMWRA